MEIPYEKTEIDRAVETVTAVAKQYPREERDLTSGVADFSRCSYAGGFNPLCPRGGCSDF